jgi:hypothetical protein
MVCVEAYMRPYLAMMIHRPWYSGQHAVMHYDLVELDEAPLRTAAATTGESGLEAAELLAEHLESTGRRAEAEPLRRRLLEHRRAPPPAAAGEWCATLLRIAEAAHRRLMEAVGEQAAGGGESDGNSTDV